MNKIVNKFLLAAEKFMSETTLAQSRFTYSAFGPFSKPCGRIQKIRETGNLNYSCKNKVDKQLCFEHNAGYSNSKNLAQRTLAHETLKDKGYVIALNPEYDGYQTGIGSMMYRFFDKKIGSAARS